MRLINVKTFQLEEFLDYHTPPYAILSHTWGSDSEELLFRDVEDGNIDKPGIGAAKFRGCCQIAAQDSLDYAWIDTCCIDKTNLVELSEAINSMFRWYQRATICYTFLSDVPSDENTRGERSKFQRSRWFQRGWTLQELLAPKTMRFYGTVVLSDTSSGQDAVNGNVIQEWHLLGTKGSMSTTIASITGIPREYLLGIAQLHTASVAQRMSWAAHRETKRKEDVAYCLLGIFDVTMSMIYGEGGERAFFRLQEQIMKVIRDDSILAWGLGINESPANDNGTVTAGRVIAKAPSDFANSGHIILRDQSPKYTSSFDMYGGSIRAHLPLLTTPVGQMVGLLSCGPKSNAQQVVGIPLIELFAGSSDEYARPQGYSSSLHSTASPATIPKLIQIKHDSQEGAPVDSGGLYFHYEDSDFTDINLKIINVVPRSCWDKERALIMSTAKANDGSLNQVLIRLRNNEQGSKDFVIVLKYKEENSDPLAECLVLICSRSISLEELAIEIPSMMERLKGKIQAKNELLSLRMTLERVEQQPIFLLRPELVLDEVFPTIDATEELREKKIISICLQLLDENEEVERQGKELADRGNLYDDYLEKLKREQERTLANIKALEERQKTLADEEKEYAGKRSEITSKQAEIREKLRGTSAQWVQAQKQWNEFRHVDDPIIGSLSGKTALGWAAAKGFIEVVGRRLDQGADVNEADKDGWILLLAALEHGHMEVARLLIEKGADLEAKAEEGMASLLLASTSGCFELVEMLLDKGAQVDGKLVDGMTPLMAATYAGHDDIVRLLLDHGAQIDARTKKNLTALKVASTMGHTTIVRLLHDRGAVDIEAKTGSDADASVTAFGDGRADSEFALMDDFDPMWREHFGQDLSDKGLSDEYIKDNQEFAIDFLKEEGAKLSLNRDIAPLLRRGLPPPLPAQQQQPLQQQQPSRRRRLPQQQLQQQRVAQPLLTSDPLPLLQVPLQTSHTALGKETRKALGKWFTKVSGSKSAVQSPAAQQL